MIGERLLKAAIVAVALFVASPSAAQTSISGTDVLRLQDDIYQASTDVSRLRQADPARATQLGNELDDLRDEVTYVKVKLRKEGSVSRSEYSDLRDRIQDLRYRARVPAAAAAAPPAPSPATAPPPSSPAPRPELYPGQVVQEDARPAPPRTERSAIPVGQELDVRLERPLSSDTAQVEDRFVATTVVDLYSGNRVLIPAGSAMRGVVSSVNRASRTDRKGSLTVAFDQVTIDGRDYPLRGTVTQAMESEGVKGEIGRIGAGSAVGAIIGGILGGGKGAVIGVLVGGGGTMAATEGKDVTLPPGTILRVRLDTPPAVR